MMKDELSGNIVLEFVGIGPKNYAYSYLNEKGKLDEDARGYPKVLLLNLKNTRIVLWADRMK